MAKSPFDNTVILVNGAPIRDAGKGDLETTLHRYTVPLVVLDRKDGPRTRAELRRMAAPLREGYVAVGVERWAWPRGPLQFAYLTDGTRHRTVAWPAALRSPGILQWRSTEERSLRQAATSGLHRELPP